MPDSFVLVFCVDQTTVRLDIAKQQAASSKQQAAPLSFYFFNGKVRPMPKITIKFLGMEVSAQGVLSVVLASIIALAALVVIWAYLDKRPLPFRNVIASHSQPMI